MIVSPELKQAIAEYKGGSTDAFSSMYEYSKNYIFNNICKIIGTGDGAYEAACSINNDTYNEIGLNIQQLQNIDDFYSWAGMIANRKCFEYINSNGQLDLTGSDEEFVDDAFLPDYVMDDQEQQRIIKQLIDTQLTQLERICLISYYYDGNQPSEIATKLNIPERAIKSNLASAKKKIQTAVGYTDAPNNVALCSLAPLMAVLLNAEMQLMSGSAVAGVAAGAAVGVADAGMAGTAGAAVGAAEAGMAGTAGAAVGIADAGMAEGAGVAAGNVGSGMAGNIGSNAMMANAGTMASNGAVAGNASMVGNASAGMTGKVAAGAVAKAGLGIGAKIGIGIAGTALLVGGGIGIATYVGDKDKDDDKTTQQVEEVVEDGTDNDNIIVDDTSGESEIPGSVADDSGDDNGNTEAISVEASDDGAIAVANNEDAIKKGYRDLVADMRNYVAKISTTGHEYISYDYMCFDYDHDDQTEIILYLGYNDADGEYYRDVVFLDYFVDREEIGVRAWSNNEHNDTHFYAEYNGSMARYSWRTSPMESYLYVVVVDDSSLSYVLEKGYDEIIVDIEGEGLHPLPLYGDWEIPPFTIE